MVCLHYGTLQHGALLPSCGICHHTGFMALPLVPPLPYPPALLRLLPTLRSVAPHAPPSAVLAALPLIADWLNQSPPSIHPRAFRINTPPAGRQSLDQLLVPRLRLQLD